MNHIGAHHEAVWRDEHCVRIIRGEHMHGGPNNMRVMPLSAPAAIPWRSSAAIGARTRSTRR